MKVRTQRKAAVKVDGVGPSSPATAKKKTASAKQPVGFETASAKKQPKLDGGSRLDVEAQRQVAGRFELGAAPPLSADESQRLGRSKDALAFLQTVWPVKLDGRKNPDAYRLMQSLPSELGDRARALLRPIAEHLAHALTAVKSYETATNVPRDYRAPEPFLPRMGMGMGFSAELRDAIAEGQSYLPARVATQLEAVAAAWDKRFDHEGMYAAGTPVFHRPTEVERLANAARLTLGEYPDEDLLAAKQAWDSGERTVTFAQDNGGSDHQTLAVRKTHTDEREFLRDFVLAQSGVFAHWQTL